MANIVKELKGKSNNYGDVDSYAKNKRGSMVLRYPIGLASSNILLNNLRVSFVSNVIYFNMDEALKSDYEILLASRMVMGRVPDMFNGYLEKNIENNNIKS